MKILNREQVWVAWNVDCFLFLCTLIKNIKKAFQYSYIPSTNCLENLLGPAASFWLLMVMGARCYTTGNRLLLKTKKVGYLQRMR